jgi:hypothetical protein
VNDELERVWRKRLWPNFMVLFQHSPGRTEENHRNPSIDSWSPGKDLKPGPPEHETGVLTTPPTTSDENFPEKFKSENFLEIFHKIFPFFIRTVDMVSLFTFYTVIIVLIL